MSIVQINQIVKKIKNTYESFLDFSDINNFDFSKKEHMDMAISRGMNAYVIEHITGCTPQEAAAAVTDSGDDNGIDAIYYDNATNCLYVTQAKYDHDGKGEPDLGSVKKFIDGFNDLLEMRFEKFCPKIQRRQTEIETILEKTSLTAKLLLIYTGVNKNKKNINEFEQLKKTLNDYGDEWVSYEYYTQKELYDILTSKNTSSIDVQLVIHNYGYTEGNAPKAYYGQVAASDIGELWKEYGSKLFASNIRNLLTKSDVNTAMLQTLETTSRLFWYYNNGITIICDNIEKQKIGGRDRSTGIFPIKNLSIVNGAQTTGTIGAYYEALSDDEVEQIFADAYVQVKVIQTKNADGKEFEKDFAKSITINNNMQNKIIARDFASQTDLQKRYKIELEQEGIVYHISRRDDEISTPTHFSISEAGRARCNTIGIKYMMIAHRGTNTYLFKNINSNEYKAVFNDTLSGIEIWNTVLIQRAIDEVLLKERKRNPDIREILIYGKDYLSYLIFNKMWRKISKTDIIEIKDHNKEEIRTYALSIAQKLSPYVKNIDKTTRNIFQNGSDIEKIHAQIKNII